MLVIFNIAMIISSILYLLLIFIFFFFRKRVNNYETKLYSALLIVDALAIFFEFLCVMCARFIDNVDKFTYFVGKTFLVIIVCWIMLFTLYIIIVTLNKEKKKKFDDNISAYSILILFVFLTNIILMYIFPLYYYKDDTVAYTYGFSTDYLVILLVVSAFIDIYRTIKAMKYIQRKKILPIFAFVASIFVLAAVRSLAPQIQIVSSTFTFITILMFFTIENPDVKMIEQLNFAKSQADRANNAKTEFLSSMSHEIRTPLNAIVGFSNTLKENPKLPEELKDEVNDILSASDNLLEIVNGVLDISKIEANKIEIVKKEYDTKKMFEELCKLTKSRIGTKPIEFVCKIDESIPRVLYGDNVRVKQVILNLLTNAAKYTDEGEIIFSVNSVKKDNIVRLIISVEDTGRGIKEENINKLFNKFERLDEEGNTTIEGTGLGLAITKKLVDLMHGNIVVQSKFGKGSKFTVSIDQGYVESPNIKLDETSIVMESMNLKDKKILLVDDNKLNIKVACRLLEQYKADITTLLSGEDTIELLKKDNKYDLILLDDMMPKMSGVETFKKLKEDKKFKVPVVMLTANAISGMKEQYIGEGLDDYLAKPIDKLELKRILNKYLGKKKE